MAGVSLLVKRSGRWNIGALQVGDRAHIAPRGMRSCAALWNTAARRIVIQVLALPEWHPHREATDGLSPLQTTSETVCNAKEIVSRLTQLGFVDVSRRMISRCWFRGALRSIS